LLPRAIQALFSNAEQRSSNPILNFSSPPFVAKLAVGSQRMKTMKANGDDYRARGSVQAFSLDFVLIFFVNRDWPE
jgi:hypothetical protein